MTMIIDIAVRSLTLGLIGALISLTTSVVNGVGAAGGWAVAFVIFVTIFAITFVTSIKSTLDEVKWFTDNGYDTSKMTKVDYIEGVERREKERRRK